jgi:hypothetical protein
VSDNDGRLVVSLIDSGQQGQSGVTVLISMAVRWSVRVSGSASDITVDLSGVQLSALELASGAEHIDLSLRHPAGTLTVQMNGGTGALTVHAATGIPVRLRLDHGSASVTVDGVKRTSLDAGTVVEPPGWNAATDRYEIDATGGASTVTVDHR